MSSPQSIFPWQYNNGLWLEMTVITLPLDILAAVNGPYALKADHQAE